MTEQAHLTEGLEYTQACHVAAFIVGYQCGANTAALIGNNFDEKIGLCRNSFHAHGPLYCRVSLECFTTWYNWCTMQGYGASSIIAENGVERLV